MLKYLHIIIALTLISSGCSRNNNHEEETVTEEIEAIEYYEDEEEEIEYNNLKSISYWEKGAYDKFPRDEAGEGTDVDFSKISSKYSGDDFNYEEKLFEGKSFWEKLKRKVDKIIEKYLPNLSYNTGNIIMYILIGLTIIALIFIFYRLVFSGRNIYINEKEEDVFGDIKFVERNLETIDIDSYIEKAVNQEKWDEAVRYLQLANLQLLARKGLIEWDYRKTNQDFLYEIKDNRIKGLFKDTTTIFNYVWFGKFEMNKEKFEEFNRDFNRLKEELL